MDGSIDVSCALTFDDLMTVESSYSFAGEVFNLQDPLQNESAQNSPIESNGLLQDKFQVPAEIKTDTEKRSDRFNNIPRKIQPVDLNSLENNCVKIVRNREKPTSLANEIDTFFKDFTSTNEDQKETSCSQQSQVTVDKDVLCNDVQSFDIDFNFCNFNDVTTQYGPSQTASTTLQNLEQHVSTEMKSSNRQLKGTQYTRCMKQRRSRPDVAPYRTAAAPYRTAQNQRLENQRLQNRYMMFWHLRKQLPVQMVSDWEIARALDS